MSGGIVMNQPAERLLRRQEMGEPAIEVRGLRKSFGEKEAVAGIDLEIGAGSLAGLVGPKGAGKTTSLSMMTVLLKVRLLLNALRSSTAAKTSFILSAFFALVVAAGGFYVLSLFRGLSASVGPTTVIFSAFALGWLILPIFAFGLDGTLDPATLQLYPVRTRPLAVGLLAASAAGAWPAANLIALLGVTVGLASGPLGLLAAVIAVALQVLFCITLARLVTTSMARLLRSRRGKDLAAFLVIPIFALVELLGQVVPRAAAQGGITAAGFAGVDAWLRWLPPGLAVHAIQDAS